MRKLISSLILVLIGIFLYGRYIEPSNIIVKEYSIEKDTIPESFKDLKILHFSDLLYDTNSSKLDKLKKIINNENADIIIFTGDLFNSDNTYNDDDYTNLENFLKDINASFYKYAISGENDEKYLDKYKELLSSSNFMLLDNASTLFFYKDITPIKIIGYKDNNADINSLLESDVEYNYTLALTHKPDNIDYLKEYNIDSVFAGHSLGGVANIPYYGSLIKLDGSKTYIDDYYKVDNIDLFINNGIGYKKFEFRIFNTPRINVYRFNK